jgi:multidrug efflux pump subunit AcrB
MKITDFSVKNYQFTLIVFVLLVAIGINSLLNMPRGEDPDFKIPYYNVVVIYPGTSPKDMEELVVNPIEKKVNELEDIKHIVTKVDDGLAIIRIECKHGIDPDKKYQDVLREIDGLRGELPKDILGINIMRFSPSDVNIMQVALLSEVAPYKDLDDWSKKLKERLEKIKTLKNVQSHAVPKQQIKVAINLDKMAKSNIPLNRVLAAIQSENINIPGGSIEMGSKQFNVKTSGDYKTIQEIQNTIVSSINGKLVYLKDIAVVEFGYEDITYLARLNGKRGVFVTAARKMGTNIFAVEDEMKPVLEQFKKELPPAIKFEQNFDNAESVRSRLTGFAKDFGIAIFLVLLTLLPLGTRASIVVMVSIPLSLAMGLFMLDIFGFSINQLSIVGLVVALGLLVDDSIVVVENIERYLRLGYSKKDAAMQATKQIGLAVLGCTATLCFAFLPLMFLPESAGDFIRSLPAAVIMTVMASLFVSLTIVPFLSSRILSSKHHPEGNIFLRGLKKIISGSYRKLLHTAIMRPYATLLVALAIFIACVSLIPVIGFSLFPNSEKPMFLINIETPLGSNLSATDQAAKFVEAELKKNKLVKTFATNVGKGNPRIYYNLVPQEEQVNYAQIFVQLDKVPPSKKVLLIDTLRTAFKSYPNAKIEVKDFEQGPPVEAPIAIRIFSENLDTMRAVAFRVEDLLRKTEGTMYVNNDLTTLKTDIKVKVNKEKAGLLGVSVVEIDRTIRMAVAGITAGKFREDDGDEFNINVMLPRDGKQSLAVFKQIYVSSYTGASIPLSQLAEIQLQTSPTTIKHYDKDRFTTITAFVQSNYNLDKVYDNVLQQMDKMALPKDVRYVAAGIIESKKESFGGLGTIILITIFGIMGILILEFKTFKGTLIVLSVVPLGIIGAVLMLWLTGNNLSFVAVVGIIALTGIEVKNSILLVDYTDQLRRNGMNINDAIQEAGETRFIPIILTTLTAIGGLTPLVLENNPLYSPLALVIIGGLISSTLLTRVVTPVLYKLLAPKVV